jgi:hypothetical protein
VAKAAIADGNRDALLRTRPGKMEPAIRQYFVLADAPEPTGDLRLYPSTRVRESDLPLEERRHLERLRDDGEYGVALTMARKDPSRRVIPVSLGPFGTSAIAYYIPFINAKGDIDVRPCPDHLKAP